MRKLGIPMVVERLIQQALHQVLSSIFDPFCSEHSYGFRPGRNAHQAVLQAREHVSGGRRWVVDMDLEKFFDNVTIDILMSRIGRCLWVVISHHRARSLVELRGLAYEPCSPKDLL